jgi:glycosyltransferase involved in cell wall biosynthesis
MDIGPTPTFSIVMPAYNTAQTIGAAIKSVLAQTRGDFELIVVNDGSTDGTAAQVEPYLSDGRVRLISQPNSGQARARNAAIEVARGTYVSLLDSDDLWLPRYLDVMAATLGADPAAAVAYTDAWVLDDELRRIARQTAMSSNQPTFRPARRGRISPRVPRARQLRLRRCDDPTVSACRGGALPGRGRRFGGLRAVASHRRPRLPFRTLS